MPQGRACKQAAGIQTGSEPVAGQVPAALLSTNEFVKTDR
jgi:hypothetical protein